MHHQMPLPVLYYQRWYELTYKDKLSRSEVVKDCAEDLGITETSANGVVRICQLMDKARLDYSKGKQK